MKFFTPNFIHYLRSYIKGCHICKLAHIEKPPVRQLQTRINPNYFPLSRVSMDLKVMSRSHKGHKFILCIIDEVTNYLITVPMYQAKSEEIGEGLIENVITKYCIPEYIIMDQDSAFMSSLMMYLQNKFNIKIRTVAPYNCNNNNLTSVVVSLTLFYNSSIARSTMIKCSVLCIICCAVLLSLWRHDVKCIK